MTLIVVPFPQAVPLNDIVAQVRAFADRLEAGEHGEVAAVFCVVPREGEYPTVFGWGDVTGTFDPVVQFELAKMWLLTNLVAR